jgi:hypothetical protein
MCTTAFVLLDDAVFATGTSMSRSLEESLGSFFFFCFVFPDFTLPGSSWSSETFGFTVCCFFLLSLFFFLSLVKCGIQVPLVGWWVGGANESRGYAL